MYVSWYALEHEAKINRRKKMLTTKQKKKWKLPNEKKNWKLLNDNIMCYLL